jgi:hypothetical protein
MTGRGEAARAKILLGEIDICNHLKIKQKSQTLESWKFVIDGTIV